MENKTSSTEEKDVFWSKVNDIVDRMHDDLANNMRTMYGESPLVSITTMEEFTAGGFNPGDIVFAGQPGDQTVWIILHPLGKCLLLAGQETEDLDWFLRFGPVDIVRVSQ